MPSKESVSVKYPDGNMSANPTATMGGAIATAARKDYRFDGWYNGSEKITESTAITDNISVTAKRTLIEMEWETTNITSGYYYGFGMGQDGKLYADSRSDKGIMRLEQKNEARKLPPAFWGRQSMEFPDSFR
jgi:uncharacterized repeat protein (TIGR02543 family)